MMQAELVSQNRQQLLKLPEAFRFNSETVYIRKDAQTGSLIVSENPWDGLWHALQAIGSVEDLPEDESA